MTPESGDVDLPEDALQGVKPSGSLSSIVSVVVVLNTATAGLGGLYTATRSLAVTMIAAVLVAVLAFCLTRPQAPRNAP